MSKYITGAGSACWGALETESGVPSYACVDKTHSWEDTPSLINMTSESISTSYNRLEEGTLLASKTRPAQDLNSKVVSGGISSVLKPDFIDFLLEWALGVATSETVTGFNSTVYTLADPNDDLPSAALKLTRGEQAFLFNGLTVSSLTLDCTAQDFVKADINVNGHDEFYDPSVSDKPANTAEGSYKCTQARLISAAAGADDISDFTSFAWDSCPAGSVYDVSRAVLTIDNGLEDAPATYCSGLLSNQPSHGQRSVTLSCEVPYSDSFETFRQTYYANEEAPNLALMLAFATKKTISGSGAPAEQVYIIIPNVSIDGADANVGGQGLINGNFNGTALSIGNTEPIKIIVRHSTSN